MPVSKGPLGMNARNFLYIRPYNSRDAKRIADDKLETKKILIANDIATPKLYASFPTRSDVLNNEWHLPTEGFVIKPARGYGGGGIVAFKQWNGQVGTTVTGEVYTKDEIKSHLLDILEGAYSLQYLPDKAYIEELIVPHPFFKKIGAIGVPDIRIIVFQRIPVMAMMRFPTQESKGKANLHLGALGFGIDLRTGITTHAISKDKPIRYIPGTKNKTRGIKIPMWDKLMLLAARTQAVSGIGYAGVDLVIDNKERVMVLEINARPGLSIQNANLTSLRTRLERVEHMPVPSPERGVEVSKSLFAEPFSEKVTEEIKVVTVIQPVTIINESQRIDVMAKLDSGASRTSFDIHLAKQLGLEFREEKVKVKSASGRGERETVKLTFILQGKKITTVASVTDRSHMKYPIIIGRRDLQGFLIKPVLFEGEETVIED